MLKAGLERLAERLPSAPNSSPTCTAVFIPVPGGIAINGRRYKIKRHASEEALLGAAGALLLDPAYAIAAGGCLRPVVMHALSHALDHLTATADVGTAFAGAADAAAASDGGGTNAGEGGKKKAKKSKAAAAPAQDVSVAPATAVALLRLAVRHERACAALGLLLELLPHVKPIALKYLRATPPPFARLVSSGGGGVGAISAGGGGEKTSRKNNNDNDNPSIDEEEGASREHALLVVRACVRLLRTVGGALTGGSTANSDATSGGSGGNDNDASTAVATADNKSSSIQDWDCTPLIRFLRHPDAEIRWTVAMVGCTS